jgi:hypothetical protein
MAMFPPVTLVRRARRHTPRRPNPVAALYVYVVELAPEAARKVHKTPNGQPVLYIGQTGLDPRQRFAQHQRGGQYGSDIVRRYGRRLLPELTSGPYPDRDAAERAERETARRLASEGWMVAGGH